MVSIPWPVHETEVLTVVAVQINAFCDVMLCRLVHWYQHFRGVSSTSMQEAAPSSKMLLLVYHTTMCCIQEHSIFITELSSVIFINNGVFIVQVVSSKAYRLWMQNWEECRSDCGPFHSATITLAWMVQWPVRSQLARHDIIHYG
jgi:hypothetical protein